MNYTNIDRTRTIDRLEIAIEALRRLHILMRESDGNNEAMIEEWKRLLAWVSKI